MSFVASHENHFMMSDELATRIDDTVATIAAAGDRAPAAGAALELVDLFRALATAQTQRERVEAQGILESSSGAIAKDQRTGAARRGPAEVESVHLRPWNTIEIHSSRFPGCESLCASILERSGQ